MMTETEMLERKRVLTEQRDALLTRLQAIKNDYGQGLDADWEEQAQELENAEVLSEISRVTAEELTKVELAISRLAAEIAKQH